MNLIENSTNYSLPAAMATGMNKGSFVVLATIHQQIV